MFSLVLNKVINTAVDIDLSKFFDEVDHDMLMNRVGRKIDKALHAPTGKYLRAGIAERETGLSV
ncbi:hypothetical protein K8P94_27305 [Klebsiella pneumoniae]